MNNFEIVSVAGKGVKLEFDTAEDASKFVDRMRLLSQRGYPMWVEDDVKRGVYIKSLDINNRLLHVPKLVESDIINDKIEATKTIVEAIDHIEWLERFFYPIVMVDGEELECKNN